jgi:hypothetical protein
MTTREALYRLIDELPESQLRDAEAYLEYLRSRAAEQADALLATLQAAPSDDEPTTAEEDADAEASWAEHHEIDRLDRDTAWLRLVGEAPTRSAW